jgi:hypothetical protein
MNKPPTPKATAVKRGRNPRWPYVPVVVHARHTEQIRGKAFATRDEAVSYAAAVIAHREADLIERMKEPRHRALREQHGLPRDCTP